MNEERKNPCQVFQGPDKAPSIFYTRYGETARRWAEMYFHVGFIVVVAVAIIELAMYFVTGWTGLRQCDAMTYLLKYVLAPTSINVALLIAATVIRRRVSPRGAALVACLLITGEIGTCYTLHSLFSSIIIGFAIVILMSTIFVDELITSVISATAIVIKILSDVFVDWDPGVHNRAFGSGSATANFLLSILLLIGCYLIARFFTQILRTHYTQEERQFQHLYHETIYDSLTGIRNRSSLREELDQRLAREDAQSCCFAMIDIDHFKELNDTFGHSVGDEYLCALAKALDRIPNAKAFRYGGDEFNVLFDSVSMEEAKAHLAAAAKEFTMSPPSRKYRESTISIGLTQFAAAKGNVTDFVHHADNALYRAKAGRNRICVFEEGEHSA